MGVRYTIPGAYFEVQDPPAAKVGEIRTDVAGFVGIADRGPFDRPVIVESWDQFRSRFGGPIREGLLAEAVRGFFDNGGQTCFVVRAGPSDGLWYAGAVFTVPGRSDLLLRVRALDPGRAGEQVTVLVVPRPAGKFSLVVRLGDDGRVGAAERERWTDLTAEDDDRMIEDTRYVVKVLERPDHGSALKRPDRGSALIRATVEPVLPPKEPLPSKYPAWLVSEEELRREKPVPPTAPGVPVLLRRPAHVRGNGDGTDFNRLELRHLTGEGMPPDQRLGLAALEECPEVSLVAIPDLVWEEPGDPPRSPPLRCDRWPAEYPRDLDPQPVRKPFTADEVTHGQRLLISHCEQLRDRFAILDTPLDARPQDVCDRVNKENLRSSYAAIYYPWLRAARRTDGDTALDRPIPPSGAVAGTIARVDLAIGPYKAPANERIHEVQATERMFPESVLALLHAGSVNPIVPVPGRGIRITGARTLTPPDRPELRYVSARRLLLLIEEKANQLGQDVVFAGNSATQRADLARMLRAYLADLWRHGGLDGATAEAAFSVVCDERNNPPEVADAGRLICDIRVKPPAPAEYVIVRIGLTVGEAKEVGGA